MSVQESVDALNRSDNAGRWSRASILVILMISILFIGFVASANAEGMTQISGIGYWPDVGECISPSDGRYFDYSFKVTGDLEGCVYVTVDLDSVRCTPSGIYQERGTEFYDIVGGSQGLSGTYISNYRFAGKYDACLLDDPLAMEIFGRCQHPVLAGSGTGSFEGVTGRINFKDDIGAGNFPYRGHFQW